MERLTEECWRNLDPWECCGQDKYCQRGCHDEGGCTNGCKVPKLYIKLAKYEDLEEQCVKDNLFGLHELCGKWKAFFEEIAELLDYHKKQEQGLLIELPVPIGAEVYKVVEDKTAATIETIKHNGHEYHRTIHCYFVCRDLFAFSMLNEVGKTVFLTYAEAKEAEEALEKMEGKA